MERSAFVIACSACLALVTGCGSSGPDIPKTAPVTGVVLYKQQPVEGAEVVFLSSAPDAKPGRGMTDAQGKFTIKTYIDAQHDLDGVIPGDYQIAVSKIDAPAAKMTGAEMSQLMGSGKAIPQATDLLPVKYKDARSSTLKATVTAGKTNEVKLELTD